MAFTRSYSKRFDSFRPHEDFGPLRITSSKIFEVFESQSRGRRSLYTKNLLPSSSHYGEELTTQDGSEYREWNAFKSKLASFILKGAQNVGIRKASSVLYLGCSTGTTVSHVSDMIGESGVVYAVDLAPVVMREMIFLSEKRKNIIPILESASHADALAARVGLCDVLFQDIAQRNQVDIFLNCADLFLKDSGVGLLAIKARSIDVTKNPKTIFAQVRSQLEAKMIIIDYKELGPFQKDHCMFMVKRKAPRSQ